MTIHNKAAFDDAQLMARLACKRVGGEDLAASYWRAATVALAAAYMGV
jgi:hypothetical protein